MAQHFYMAAATSQPANQFLIVANF